MAEHPDRAFFQAFALTLVTKVLSDIRCWAEQPHPEPLPKDWDCTYRRDLSGVIEQAVANFAGDSETVARLRRTERLARDVVSAMSSSVAVSSKPAVEWPEAYAAYFQKMLSEELFLRELRDSLDAKDRRETKRRRQPASDTHAAAPSDAGRIGRDELHDSNGVTGGGTSTDQATEPMGDDDAEFTEPISKTVWCVLLECSKGTLRKRLGNGTYRVKSGTPLAAKLIALHIDGLPKELKARHDRKRAVDQAELSRKRTARKT